MKHSTLTMFRRVMAMTLALLLVVGLTGCIGKGDDKPTDPAAVVDPTKAPTEAPTEKPTEAPTEAPTEPPVKGVMGTVSANNLNVRSNHVIDSAILSQLPVNLRVEILEQKTVGGTNWGRIGSMTLPNGTKIDGGWLNLHYVKLDNAETQAPTEPGTSSGTTTVDPDEEKLGTITAEQLQIRKGAGTTYDTAGSYKKGDRVKVLETKTVSGTTWGRTEKGWISMTYVKLDGSAGSATDTGTNVKQPGATTPTTGSSSGTGTGTGTSTASKIEVSNGKTTIKGYVVVDTKGLTLRAGPGTKYKSLGTAVEGDRYPYYQTDDEWYRTSHGWLSNADEEYLYIEGDTADDAGIVTIKANKMHVRQGPGTNFKSVDTLKKGERLVVLGQSDDWGYTRLGWISMDDDYVDFTNKLVYTSFIGEAEVLVDGLNYREKADADSKSYGTMKAGTEVTVTAIDDNWGKIHYKSKDAWINLSYVKMTDPDPAPTTPTTPATKYDVIVTYAVAGEGTVKPAELEYAKGAEVILTATPGTNKMVNTITATDADGKNVPVTQVSENKYKFTMPESDVTVLASFTVYAKTYKINTSAGVSANYTSCTEHTDVTLTVTEAAGKVLDELVVKKTGGSDTDTVTTTGSGNTYTFKMPAFDVTVTATFKNEYTVTIGTISNGTVTANKSAACEGDKVALTITPDANYTAGTVKVNGSTVTLVGNEFTMPAANVTVTVDFIENINTTSAGSYKVVADGQTTIYSKANSSSTALTQKLNKDETVEVVGTVDSYYKIKLGTGYGYVPVSALNKV